MPPSAMNKRCNLPLVPSPHVSWKRYYHHLVDDLSSTKRRFRAENTCDAVDRPEVYQARLQTLIQQYYQENDIVKEVPAFDGFYLKNGYWLDRGGLSGPITLANNQTIEGYLVQQNESTCAAPQKPPATTETNNIFNGNNDSSVDNSVNAMILQDSDLQANYPPSVNYNNNFSENSGCTFNNSVTQSHVINSRVTSPPVQLPPNNLTEDISSDYNHHLISKKTNCRYFLKDLDLDMISGTSNMVFCDCKGRAALNACRGDIVRQIGHLKGVRDKARKAQNQMKIARKAAAKLSSPSSLPPNIPREICIGGDSSVGAVTQSTAGVTTVSTQNAEDEDNSEVEVAPFVPNDNEVVEHPPPPPPATTAGQKRKASPSDKPNKASKSSTSKKNLRRRQIRLSNRNLKALKDDKDDSCKDFLVSSTVQVLYGATGKVEKFHLNEVGETGECVFKQNGGKQISFKVDWEKAVEIWKKSQEGKKDNFVAVDNDNNKSNQPYSAVSSPDPLDRSINSFSVADDLDCLDGNQLEETAKYFGEVEDCMQGRSVIPIKLPMRKEMATTLQVVELPTSIGHEIPDASFQEFTALQSIDFSKTTGLQVIGQNGFQGCVNLERVVIPSSITLVKAGAFKGCTGLISFQQVSNINNIFYEDGIFEGCTSLSCIKLPETLNRIYRDTFKGCTSLQYITVPEAVKIIYPRAFEDCTSLKEVEIPEESGLYIMWDHVFANCSALESIILPPGIYSFGDGCFRNSALKNICLFGLGFRQISSDSFNGSSLISIDIPDSVEVLKAGAFQSCQNLRHVWVSGTNLSQLEQDVFMGCSALQSVTIPSDGAELRIGEGAFEGCNSLRSIYIPTFDTREIFWQEGKIIEGCYLLQRCNNREDEYDRIQQTLTWLTMRFSQLPAHYACYTHRGVVDLSNQGLNGQDYSLTDALGMTPLHILCCNPKCSLEMMQYIINKFPAAVDEYDITGMRPLELFLQLWDLHNDNDDATVVAPLKILLKKGISLCKLEMVYTLNQNSNREDTIDFTTIDEESRLSPFMLAATNKNVPFDVVYYLAINGVMDNFVNTSFFSYKSVLDRRSKHGREATNQSGVLDGNVVNVVTPSPPRKTSSPLRRRKRKDKLGTHQSNDVSSPAKVERNKRLKIRRPITKHKPNSGVKTRYRREHSLSFSSTEQEFFSMNCSARRSIKVGQSPLMDLESAKLTPSNLEGMTTSQRNASVKKHNLNTLYKIFGSGRDTVEKGNVYLAILKSNPNLKKHVLTAKLFSNLPELKDLVNSSFLIQRKNAPPEDALNVPKSSVCSLYVADDLHRDLHFLVGEKTKDQYMLDANKVNLPRKVIKNNTDWPKNFDDKSRYYPLRVLNTSKVKIQVDNNQGGGDVVALDSMYDSVKRIATNTELLKIVLEQATVQSGKRGEVHSFHFGATMSNPKNYRKSHLCDKKAGLPSLFGYDKLPEEVCDSILAYDDLCFQHTLPAMGLPSVFRIESDSSTTSTSSGSMDLMQWRRKYSDMARLALCKGDVDKFNSYDFKSKNFTAPEAGTISFYPAGPQVEPINMLHPHTDDNNGFSTNYNHTATLSCLFKASDVQDTDIRKMLKRRFCYNSSDWFQFVFIRYSRKNICDLCQEKSPAYTLHFMIEKAECPAQKKIMQFVSDKAYSDWDYEFLARNPLIIGNLQKILYKEKPTLRMVENFDLGGLNLNTELDKAYSHGAVIINKKAAVDKRCYDSAAVDQTFSFGIQFGLDKTEYYLVMAMLFCIYCSGPSLYIQALESIMNGDHDGKLLSRKKDIIGFFNHLSPVDFGVMISQQMGYENSQRGKNPKIGYSSEQRSTHTNIVLPHAREVDKDVFRDSFQKLKCHIESFWTKIGKDRTTVDNNARIYKECGAFVQLIAKSKDPKKKIAGVGDFTAMVLVQFLGVLGILPVECSTYGHVSNTPKCGSLKFFKDTIGSPSGKKVADKTDVEKYNECLLQICKNMNDSLSRDSYTPQKVENICCEIYRKKRASDPIYCFGRRDRLHRYKFGNSPDSGRAGIQNFFFVQEDKRSKQMTLYIGLYEVGQNNKKGDISKNKGGTTHMNLVPFSRYVTLDVGTGKVEYTKKLSGFMPYNAVLEDKKGGLTLRAVQKNG